jgi:purine-nucleoside phosphorylase
MDTMYENVQEAADYIKSKCEIMPQSGIILGTGLGSFSEMMAVDTIIEYSAIPNFPRPTVQSHKGNLLIGHIGDAIIAVLQGRFHYYEGYSLQEVTFPVRVLKAIGIKNLIITNAAGGMNAEYEKGDIVIIDDHLNLTGLNPLIGVGDERLGVRFPDMCQPYDERLKDLAEAAAREKQIAIKRGVYAWVTGPCLETKAEYTFMHRAGADLVGMSTVPEVIVAIQSELKVLGLSCVTDVCIPEALKPVNIEEIIKTAEEAGPKMDHIIKRLLEKL